MSTEHITLSPRLQAVADWVPPNSLFADIGTDHGYLPLFLCQEGKISTAIAADLNQGPLDAAKKTSLKVQIPLDLRLSNGLEKISPSEVDCVAIAGMGGMTILQILQAWQSQLPQNWSGTFLLQPMSTQKELRTWLNQEGYTIQQERTIREGNTLYTIIKVKVKREEAYHLGELLVGRQHLENPDENRLALLDLHLTKLEKILTSLPTTPDNAGRKQELQQQQQQILSMREEWTKWQSQ